MPRAPAKPAAPKRRRRTIPVHALADDRLHLAPAQHGRLRQGYLKTLCGRQAVSELSPFVMADPAFKRCQTCFRMVDKDGFLVG